MKSISGLLLAGMGAVGLAMSASAQAPYTLENFETWGAGSAMVDNDPTRWAGTTNAVITNYTYDVVNPPIVGDHTKTLFLQEGGLTNIVAGDANVAIWSDFAGMLGHTDTNAISVDSSAQLAFCVNTNGHLVLWHDNPQSGVPQWTEFSDTTIASDEWVRVSMKCDYNIIDSFYSYPYFQIYLNGRALTNQAGFTSNDGSGTAGGSWFALTDTAFTTMTNFIISGQGLLDDLVISTNSPTFFWRIVASVGPRGGAVSPQTNLVTTGADSTNLISVDQWYYIASVQTNGMPAIVGGPTVSNIVFVWSNVLASGSVFATIAPNTATNDCPLWWLALNGLPATPAGALSDLDQDGQTAWQEYIAGTDPNNSNSVFEITEQSFSNGVPTFKWPCFTNSVELPPYGVQKSTNIALGAWILVDGNVTRTPPVNTWTASTTDSVPYRVVATNVPGM
jgi:hypothetical protein